MTKVSSCFSTWIGAAALSLLLAASLSVLPFEGALAQGYSVGLAGHEYLAKPGDTISGIARITGFNDIPKNLVLHAASLVRDPNNTRDYGSDQSGLTDTRSIVDWMTFTPDQVSVKKGETRYVKYTIQIPKDASLNGSYWCELIISDSPDAEKQLEAIKKQQAGGTSERKVGVVAVFEYAVRIIITIQGTETRKATFRSITNAVEKGAPVVRAVFSNEGNVYLQPKVWLDIKDVTGKTIYHQPHPGRTVLPASALDFDFDMSEVVLDPGDYAMLVVADYGVPKMVGAQAKVHITEADTQKMKEFAAATAKKREQAGKPPDEPEAAAPAGE